MSVAFDNKPSGDGQFNSATSASYSFTPAASANLLIAYLFADPGSGSPVSGVTISWNSQNFTAISGATQANPSFTWANATMYQLANPTGTGSAQTLSGSWTGTASGYLYVTSWIVTGGSPSVGNGTGASAGSGTNPSLSVTSTGTGDAVTGGITTPDNVSAAGPTQLFVDTSGSASNAAAARATGAAGSVSLTSTVTVTSGYAWVGANITTAASDTLMGQAWL